MINVIYVILKWNHCCGSVGLMNWSRTKWIFAVVNQNLYDQLYDHFAQILLFNPLRPSNQRLVSIIIHIIKQDQYTRSLEWSTRINCMIKL